jgi:hypothetical protein
MIMGHIEATRKLPPPADAVWALIANPSTWQTLAELGELAAADA